MGSVVDLGHGGLPSLLWFLTKPGTYPSEPVVEILVLSVTLMGTFNMQLLSLSKNTEGNKDHYMIIFCIFVSLF